MGYWIWAIGYWLLGIGYWVLAIGDWLLDMGGKAAYPCLYTLHLTLYALHPTLYTDSPAFTLKATATTPLTFRLIAVSHHHLYALISLPAKGSVLTQMPQADAEALRVARVKTNGQFGRTSYLRPKGDKCCEWFE